MPPKSQLTPKGEKFKSILAVLSDSLGKDDFLKAFQQVLTYVKGVEARLLGAIDQYSAAADKRIDAHLATIKPIKGDKGDSIKGDKGDQGDPPSNATLIELIRTLQPELEPVTGEEVRNLLEVLQGENRYQVHIEDVEGLSEYLFGLKKQFEKTKVIHVGAPQVTTSSGGATITTETPGGIVDSVNVTFTPSKQPLWVVSDSATYYEGKGYTWDGSNITMGVAPSQFIRDIISS